MIEVRRLLVASALLAVGIVLTCTDVWGEAGRDKAKEKELRDWRRGESMIQPVVEDARPVDDADKNKFADQPAIAYQTADGDTLFALQVRPKLADEPARPTDYLIVVDTSASKAMGHLEAAIQMAEELRKNLKPDDKLSLWTANIKPIDLTRGFKAGKDLDAAFKDLSAEVPLGAVDLKKVLTEAIASFEVKASRRRALVFLGDGKSVANPVDADARAELCQAMIRKQVGFFPVPLGPTIDSANIHGLATGTGGKVVRHGHREAPTALVTRLIKDVAEPVLYTTELTLPAAATEVVPSKMPPLRRDVATLVVGKLKADMKLIQEVTWRAAGEVSGKEVRAEATLKVPAAEEDNFFLQGVHGQWKSRKEQPALLAADRALGYAHKQNQLALEDVLAKADTALEKDKLEAAKKLYEKAQEFAPHSGQARAGLKLIHDMMVGKKTRAQILKELRVMGVKGVKRTMVRVEDGKRKIVVLADGDEKEEDKAPPERDPLDDIKARREIARQQADAMVTEAIRMANRLVRTDPDEAVRSLRVTRDELRADTLILPADIAAMTLRLERAMETLTRVGATIKRDAAEAAALRAAADARLDVRRAETLAQDRIRERMRVFHNLMDQARELEASRQANSIREDLVNAGVPVPTSVTAAYRVGQSAYYLREQRDLRRVREERFLSVLLEVERSHVPFPDEPPIEFPSSAMIKRMTRGQFDNWTDFSKYRINRYGVTSFGSDVPGRFKELQELLNRTVKDIDLSEIERNDLKLGPVMDIISKKYRFAYSFEERAFRDPGAEGAPKDPSQLEVRGPLPNFMERPTSLGGVLKKVLARVTFASPLTYVIRRDEIEITTEEVQKAEKALRVYPVADLVFPTLNAFNQQQVQQTGSLFGAFGAQGFGGGLQLGMAGGQIGNIGGGLQLGGGFQLGGFQLGGQLGGGFQLGGGGFQLGGVGGLNVGAMMGANVGANMGGPAGLQVGGFNCQGAVNMGVGGGAAGFTGGQLGQLGNLGGQFGMQGGDQSQLLIQLIRQVVGKPRDWAMQYNPVTGQPCNPLDDEQTEGGPLGEDNQLGYYPPAFALVVKGTTRLHTRENNVIFSKVGGGAAPGDGGIDAPIPGKPLAKGPGGKGPGGVDVAGAGGEKDPREIWQTALARGAQEPGMIIATADFLVLNKKWDHTAEFLKANLRKSLVVQPWVYRSLSIALRESGAKADDIERAEVSVADMEPMDSSGYLLAARALAEDKNYERALAFCKQAAVLEPGASVPYADAARYAEMAGDAKAMEWAAGHLLKQDWPVKNDELKQSTLDRVDALARRVDKVVAERLRTAVEGKQRRDLVVKLVWQGQAGLDLKVQEPTGSVCDVLRRQTIGGGTLIADLIGSTGQTYTAAEAFTGEYKVSVERAWGKPLGSKAQLRVIRYQGTKDETEELIPLKIDSNLIGPIVLKLEGGRRTEVAYVPPETLNQPVEEEKADGRDDVMSKLFRFSEAETTGVNKGFAAGVNGAPTSRQELPRAISRDKEQARTLYQQRVRSLISSGVDVTAHAVLSADRRAVKLRVEPHFDTVNTSRPVTVRSPVVPGSP